MAHAAPGGIHARCSGAQLIIYEVTSVVREGLRARYEIYMRDRHIADVLATGLFVGAQFMRADDGRFRTRYEFAEREALDRYLSTHATRMRADFMAHFPEGVEFERDVWNVLSSWPH
jgi:hypothetical protein